MPLEEADGEEVRAQWAQANRERLKQQEAAKWARDHDPWHYIEDEDYPKKDGTYLVKICYDGREIYKTADWMDPAEFKPCVYNFILTGYNEDFIVAWTEIPETKR